MRRVLLASTALALAGQAFAAEPRPSWSGCYVGGHVGIGWGRTDISEPTEPIFQFFAPANAAIGVNSGGNALGGAQVGCDYQFAQSWVGGISSEFSWADIQGQAIDPFFAGKSGGPITLRAKIEWMAAVTGRVGYAWDQWLVYGKGGAAWARHKYSIQNLTFWGNPTLEFCLNSGSIAACNPSGSATRAGWVIGMGLEWAFTRNWTLGVEYTHYDFGTYAVTLSDPNGVSGAPASGPVNVKHQVEAVKFSVNHRFAPTAFGR